MILKGDCIGVMKAIKPNSVDAIVCDPPYGLEFMGKEWDKLGTGRKNNPFDPKGKKFQKGGTIPLPLTPSHERKKIPKCKICGKWKYNAHKKSQCFCKSPDFEIDTWTFPSKMQLWHTQWLTEAYRVLKPGGSMLVMGGTRTSHRLACAIEDSGFIIKDTLMWLYGSGFPKAQDLGKMIDKRAGEKREKIADSPYKKIRGIASRRGELYGKGLDGSGNIDITAPTTDLAKHWNGFKVGGIKPAYEPIIWAVKPPKGSYVDNLLKWGVGAVNVDECRIGISNNDFKLNTKKASKEFIGVKPFGGDGDKKGSALLPNTKGRFPANIILSHHPECVQMGMKRVSRGGGIPQTTIMKPGNVAYGKFKERKISYYGGKDGLETVESWDCHPDCAVRLLDEQSGNLSQVGGAKKTTHDKGIFGIGQPGQVYFDGNAGASRFFYCAKASRAERNAGLDEMEEKHNPEHRFGRYRCKKCGKLQLDYNSCECKNPDFERIEINKNNHPTVKPIKLFEYLIKLVTREGQIVLDPFIGSGTTAIAAHNTGRKCVGIEKEDEYLEIAKRRTDYWKSQPKQMEMGL